jgi:uncharacterized membrane protein YdjX (TVP38/TMEM64 family)
MNILKYITIFILSVVLILPFFFIDTLSTAVMALSSDSFFLVSIVYVLLLVASVVIAPFSMPLFFAAGGILGPQLAVVYNIIGWSIGAAIAFWLARMFGKPFLQRFALLKNIEKYEQKIPQNLEFFSVVLLRMVIPVDILSYVLGFFSNISFMRYIIATIIGIIPFSIIFAYGGSAIFEGKYFIAATFAMIVLVSFGIGFYIFNKK